MSSVQRQTGFTWKHLCVWFFVVFYLMYLCKYCVLRMCLRIYCTLSYCFSSYENINGLCVCPVKGTQECPIKAPIIPLLFSWWFHWIPMCGFILHITYHSMDFKICLQTCEIHWLVIFQRVQWLTSEKSVIFLGMQSARAHPPTPSPSPTQHTHRLEGLDLDWPFHEGSFSWWTDGLRLPLR